MRDNVIIFDGVQTDEFSTFITNAGVYESPQPEYERVEIEGRNGDLLLEKGKYSNVTVKYPAVIYKDFVKNYMKLRSFMLSRNGYKRLEDSFNPDKFRIGRFTDKITPKYPYDLSMGAFELNFYCKPQWFLKSGEEAIEIREETELMNPTLFTSLPKYRVYGSGTFSVNDVTVTVNEGATNYVDIDCDIMDSYEGQINRNGIVIREGGWPVLKDGVNHIIVNGIEKLELYPRWFTL